MLPASPQSASKLGHVPASYKSMGCLLSTRSNFTANSFPVLAVRAFHGAAANAWCFTSAIPLSIPFSMRWCDTLICRLFLRVAFSPFSLYVSIHYFIFLVSALTSPFIFTLTQQYDDVASPCPPKAPLSPANPAESQCHPHIFFVRLPT